MKLENVRQIVQHAGCHAVHPSRADWSAFMQDMDELDRAEAASTWRKNWLAEMQATYDAATTRILVFNPRHEGCAVFGLTAIEPNLAQIWLLQSKAFSRCARKHHGRIWPIKGARLVRDFTGLALKEHRTVFNFIPRSREQNIRLLKAGGFDFFAHPTSYPNTYFFSAGTHGASLAKNSRFWEAFLGNAAH